MGWRSLFCPYNLGYRCGGAMLATQRTQVLHRPVGHSEKCVGDGTAPPIRAPGLADSHDAAAIAHIVGAAGPSAEGPQVDHAASLSPQKGATASADDLAPVVDAERDAGGLPDGSEISHPVRRRPKEGMRLARARLRKAYDFASVVHVVRDARRPAEGAQVDDPARLGNEEGVLGGRAADPAVPRDM